VCRYNLLGENINILNKNTEALLDVRKEVGLEVNAEKIRYMFMTCHQTTGQSHNMKVVTGSLKMGQEFKYLGTTVTNQNCIH
jgi:hypothetical protein